MIGGRNGKVAFPETRSVAKIVEFPARVPASLFGVNVVKTVLLALVETHVIENKEFGFGAKVGSVGDARGGQIQLGFTGNVTGVAIVALLGHGIHDIAEE